jgi:hypothetical protein
LVDAADQANENFMLSNSACAISASFAAFEGRHHLANVASVKHAHCRSHG